MKPTYLLSTVLSLLFTACGTIVQADSKIGVEISGVNYSDKPITYVISSPNDPGSVGAEPLDPFAAGGLMCCFRLPEKWQPGIKVRVQILDTNRAPVTDELVDLPPYVDESPGRIWAVHYQDGTVDVLSSDYGPPHEKWPGKVKGWPIPTIEYRRKLWQEQLNIKLVTLLAAKSLIKELNEFPDQRLKKSWEHKLRYSQKEIEPFNGPNDPAYKDHLAKHYQKFVTEAQEEVNDWMARKP